MSGFLHDFHFLRPWWLLALLALPPLWRALSAGGAGAQAWRGAVDAHLLDHLLVRGADARPARAPRWLAAAALSLASLALAGPAWERLPQPLYRNQAARVIALELSPSMLAQDVKPSRYQRARYKILDILKKGGDAQVALIAYAGDAFVVAPLTDDANTVAHLVDSLDPTVMPVPGNDAGRAIDLGVNLIRQAGLPQGEIVLLADDADAVAKAAAARARAAGVRVSVLGIGTEQGAPVALPQGGFAKDANGNIVLPRLGAAALQAVADAGGGRYAVYRGDNGDVDALPGSLAATGGEPGKADETQAQSLRFLDRGPWLALLLLPLAALGFRRGWLMLLPLALLLRPDTAHAGWWDDLWQRRDQQAQTQLDAGKLAEAQSLAVNPDLRGTAAYRAGDFAAAGADFGGDSADARYNRGNALAKQGKFEEAIAAYDDALKRAPGMDDAQANKRAVEEFLKQQQQQKQQQDKQDHQGQKQNSQGNDQPQPSQGEDGKGEQGEGKDGKPSPQQRKDDKGAQAQDGQSQDGQQRQDDAKGAQGKPGDEKDAARQPGAGSEANDQAQQQYQQKMDQAIGKDAGQDAQAGKEPQPVRLGAREGKPVSEKDQAVERMLQTVPDDPGGLLRRKFQLEYQRRQQGGTHEDQQ